MKNKLNHFRTFFALICTLLGMLSLNTATQAKPLQVVASFSILGDWVQQIGGENIQLTVLIQAGGDAHVFEPSAQNARTISQADILFINGLEFEPWLERLKTAARFKGIEITASQGIVPRKFHADEPEEHDNHHPNESAHHNHNVHASHNHGEFDPHAWQNVRNAIIYVHNIEQALSQADPANAPLYQQRAQAYIKQLEELDQQIRTATGQIPENRRIIVTAHNSLGYFADAYGFKSLALSGISTDEEPSAANVAQLIRLIRELQIPALFLENTVNPKLIERIASETQATLGGTLYADALSAPGTPADNYIAMIQSNLHAIVKALSITP